MNGDLVHRLGVVVGMVLLVGWLTRGLAATRRERALRRRITGLLAPEPAPPAPRHAEVLSTVRPWLPLLGPVGAGWALIGGVAGVLVGLMGAGALWRWSARRSAAGTSAADAATAAASRQLPLAADLLAACIAAGASPVTAARAVGDALGGPVGDALGRGAAEVRLGGEPDGAWRGLAAVPGADGLVRLLERAGESGAPAAAPVARFAAECRAERARHATTAARRAAVTITAPVGLCFLPAFLVVGVVPVVLGLGVGVFGGR